MSSTATRKPAPHGMAPTLMRVFGILAAFAALIGAVCFLRGSLATGEPGSVDAVTMGMVMGWITAGIAIIAVLFGLAATIDLQRTLVARVERLESTATSDELMFPDLPGPRDDMTMPMETPTPATATDRPRAAAEVDWPEMLNLLRDIRDASLLNDSQRTERRQRLANDDIARASDRLKSMLESGHFPQARVMVDDLVRRFPEREELRAMAGSIEDARARMESRDVSGYTKRCEELMSISAWDRAAQVARELVDRHPANESAIQLCERVQRERSMFRSEQIRRMYAEIQRFVTRRRWREAYESARTFVDRFPDTQDADAISAQLPTLKGNAEIEDRQELEAKITELAKQGRYAEAHQLAQGLIKKYPTSPQAEALRVQLPRLLELATNPLAQPARQRVEL